jgi:hypothetical protein
MSFEPLSINWLAIDPEDVDVLEFDFAVYAAGSAITSQSVSAEVLRGVHATPQDILLGAPVPSGDKLYQRVSNAVAGVVYKVRARAVFADGRAQVLAGILPCVRR